MKIAAIQHGDLGRRLLQGFRGVKPAKTTAQDHHAMPSLSFHSAS
jgi:hypothetical protein